MISSNFLSLNKDGQCLRLVYCLKRDLEVNQDRLVLTQNLTLDENKPLMGLKGTYGLFGSSAWWDNLHQRRMPLVFVSGIVLRVYVAGQDKIEANNMLDLKLGDGTVINVGIYVNDKRDVELFKIGRRASVVYALDELKQQPAADGGVNYSRIALEMAVSPSTAQANSFGVSSSET
ncbi:hypothetical protein [Pseudomonas sp. RGM2987]|uniref:hypothetical protein n=1 Tax=Pseudomonas sp. RGM2987 TaxID=2930090 RepID=UPI001FD6CA6F|nr:hypothetical protein [Pseudomonas sp. RGM2987]MCJ8206801.1 hypothetical protein [Pseudomonas sp. RGM2987]